MLPSLATVTSSTHNITSQQLPSTSTAPMSSRPPSNSNRKKDLVKKELDVDQLLQPSQSSSKFATIFDLNSPLTNSLSRGIIETSPSAAGTPLSMDPHRFHEASPLQHSPSTTLAPYISDFSHTQQAHNSSSHLNTNNSSITSILGHSPSGVPPSSIRYISATTGGTLSGTNTNTNSANGACSLLLQGSNSGNISKASSMQFPPLTSASDIHMPFNLPTPTFLNSVPYHNHQQPPPVQPPSNSTFTTDHHHSSFDHQASHPQPQQPLPSLQQQGSAYTKSPNPSSSLHVIKPLNSPASSYHSQSNDSGNNGTEAKEKSRIVTIPDSSSATGSLTIDTDGLLMIEEGFDLPPPNPQPGGKQNKKPLPRHIISIRISGIPRYQFYSMKVSLLGYKTKQKEVLKDIVEPVLLSKSKVNLRGDSKRVDMHFDNIIIDEASHMNGRKFFVRFTLLSPDKLPVAHVDSSYFETITDRGNQKRQQKIDHSRSKISKVLKVSPRYSIVQGGQLVKVLINQQIVAPNNVYVYFGDKRARCVYVSPSKDNTIVCETPDGNADEEVEVKVSLDKGKTFMATDASLRYVPFNSLNVNGEANGRVSPSSMPFLVNREEIRLKNTYPAPSTHNDEEYEDHENSQEYEENYEDGNSQSQHQIPAQTIAYNQQTQPSHSTIISALNQSSQHHHGFSNFVNVQHNSPQMNATNPSVQHQSLNHPRQYMMQPSNNSASHQQNHQQPYVLPTSAGTMQQNQMRIFQNFNN
ncbi:hypothetical protein C9374_011080 [Naegleria lovaniensis]|uniref:Uncharacterized protein n=1 Tax=Naegleria lovaniensis TaxID=51637 RepID=A0AA88GFH7_NAELO|nr:uncharacterized protein C9374_011080 [Naegleria lovaniensis]KAG2374243.1 hypothetical protein C9374_011080 [Naegleria lovaniensis]